jgi:hypothetical protein
LGNNPHRFQKSLVPGHGDRHVLIVVLLVGRMMANLRRWWRSVQLGLLGLCLGLCLSGLGTPSAAQSMRVSEAWKQIYQQLPALPQENQYIDRATKQPDQANTFVGRLISYHLYSKNRPAALRLDWKHTIADYLGANEDIDADLYPTQKRLRTNPLDGDRAVLQNLSRTDRDRLVQVLVSTLGAPVVKP